MVPSNPLSSPRWSRAEHRREQARRGLELSPAERLRWLETTMAEMKGLLGRAATERTDDSREPDSSSAEPDRDSW